MWDRGLKDYYFITILLITGETMLSVLKNGPISIQFMIILYWDSDFAFEVYHISIIGQHQIILG